LYQRNWGEILAYSNRVPSLFLARQVNMCEEQAILKENLSRHRLFFPDDLSFNQMGEISPRQIRGVKLSLWFWFAGIAVFLFMFVVIFVIGAKISFSAQKSEAPFFMIFWFVFFLLNGYLCYSNATPHLNDLRENRVQVVSGKLIKHHTLVSTIRSGSNFYCTIEIRGQQFYISLSAYNDIAEDQTYRLFYLPHSRKILNLVPWPY